MIKIMLKKLLFCFKVDLLLVTLIRTTVIIFQEEVPIEILPVTFYVTEVIFSSLSNLNG